MRGSSGASTRWCLVALLLCGGASFHASGATTYTILHTFQSASGGAAPGPLLLDKAGHLWGAASMGGKQNGGVFFELKPPAAGQTLWHFKRVAQFEQATGTDPLGPFVERKGDFYGPTSTGGSGKGGVVYRLTEAGATTDLQSFAKDGPPRARLRRTKQAISTARPFFSIMGKRPATQFSRLLLMVASPLYIRSAGIIGCRPDCLSRSPAPL
jgi:uncharacterized repeat protein (TIGR03803 family)